MTVLPLAEKCAGSAVPKKRATSAAAAAVRSGRARLPGRVRQRDPPAPRQRRLARGARPGIGQAVALDLIHQDERVEHHLFARCPDRPDRLDHRGIRRGAAVDRGTVHLRNLLRRSPRRSRPRATASRPRHDCVCSTFGRTSQRRTAQVIAEPRHDQRHRPDALAVPRSSWSTGWLRNRSGRMANGCWPCRLRPRPSRIMDRRRRQPILAGSGDQRHTLNGAAQGRRRVDSRAPVPREPPRS